MNAYNVIYLIRFLTKAAHICWSLHLCLNLLVDLVENSFCTVIHVSPFIISSLNGWVIVPNLNLWPSKIFCQKLFELARENNKVEWLLSVYSVDIRHISDCLAIITNKSFFVKFKILQEFDCFYLMPILCDVLTWM